MALNRPTINEIYARIKADMEARVSSNTRIPRYSLLGIMAIVFAGAVHLLYGYLVWLADQLFIDTATTWFLDRIANLYGLPRKASTYTVGEVRFTGVNSTLVAEGTVVVNSDGIEYTTDEDVTVASGVADVSVTAAIDSPGSVGNTLDTELSLQSPEDELDTAVRVLSGFDNGVDEETDDALRDRLRQRLQNPPSSGTCADFVRWCLEVQGVGRAWCFDAESDDPSDPTKIQVGAGKVVVVIASSDLSPVGATIKQNTIDYLNTVKPGGAVVDVYEADPKAVVLSISIKPNTSDVQTAISSNLTDLFVTDTAPSGTVLLSGMNSAIAAGAVTDYKITAITYDGGSIPVDNITSPGLEVAQFTNAIYGDI